MTYLDLVSLLKIYNLQIKGVEVYGKIVSVLPKPSNIGQGVICADDGMFVRMDIFAIRLSSIGDYLRRNGFENENDTFMVNGSLITFVPKVGYNYPDWYTISGTLAASKTQPNCVSVFSWAKPNNKQWHIFPSKLYNLDISGWSHDGELRKYLALSYQEGHIVQPAEVSALAEVVCTVSNYTLVQNTERVVSQPTQTVSQVQSKNSLFKHESRDTILEESETARFLQSSLVETKAHLQTFIRTLKTKYMSKGEVNDYIRYTVRGIDSFSRHKPSPNAMTGSALLRAYLKHFDKLANENYLGTTTADYLSKIFDEIKELFENPYAHVNCDGDAWLLCKKAFLNYEGFYAGILSVITGVNYDKLQRVADLCSANDLSFSMIVNENPYILQILGDFSFNDIEYLSLCLERQNIKTIDKERNIAILHAMIMDTNDGSTAFRISELGTKPIGIKLTKAKYTAIQSRGTYLTDKQLENIDAYIYRINRANLGYDLSTFKSCGNAMISRLSVAELNCAVKDYIDVGLGVQYKDFLMSSRFCDKAMYVYEKCRELGEAELDYDDAEIEQYINEYENIVGFKLEPEQRKAVYLLKHKAGIITGCAGSGKTTISKCMVYVLEHLEPGITIKFAAPTGKAAKRMQEVVGREVKTLHSMFKISTAESTFFDKEDEFDATESNTVYMFDEGAMIKSDLFYTVMRNIDTVTNRFYLFGDIHQLPPIGKGLPFKDLLRFMPCRFLGVSKRAAEGSDITKNSDYINNYSTNSNWKNLETGKDFILAPCSDENIQKLTYLICKYYLNKTTPEEESILKQSLGLQELPKVPNLSADDIQVVSPIGKETYDWGSIKLNKVLQPLFNPTKDLKKCFTYAPNSYISNRFAIGDRVIHTNSNMYCMQWYSSYNKSTNTFQKMYGYGICNGETGTIVDFIKADSCSFLEEIESQKPDNFEYPESLRDDLRFGGSDAYFVVVKYYDYMSNSDFLILYHANDAMQANSTGLSLKGDDLDNLLLFYAGTAHKLQGSQYKLVISVLGKVSFKGFITRNMMYTVFTRGENLVFAIGSVSNDTNSMLSVARREVSEEGVLTIGEIVCEF